MPVTVFHLGPALVVKAAAPRWFSLGAFTLVQVAIDLESAANILTGRYPFHGPLHSLAGSLLVAALLVGPARYGLTWLYSGARRLEARADRAVARLLAEFGPVSWTAAVWGAGIGGVTHVLLDAVIHPDVAPLAPWSAWNPLYVSGTFVWVHALATLAGVVGVVFWFARARETGPRRAPRPR